MGTDSQVIIKNADSVDLSLKSFFGTSGDWQTRLKITTCRKVLDTNGSASLSTSIYDVPVEEPAALAVQLDTFCNNGINISSNLKYLSDFD